MSEIIGENVSTSIRNLSRIRAFDARPKTGKWHQKPPMVRKFCELTEMKMNENECDILCKRLEFFFFFQKIAYSTTLVLGNFSSGVFLEEIIVLDF